MKTWMLSGMIALVSTIVTLSGCGGGGDSPAPTESSSSGGEETKTASVASTSADQHRIVGVWLGVAFIDQEKLQSTLDSMTDEAAKQNLLLQAQTFQSMLVGTEFLVDGTFTLDAEITPVGSQPSRDQSGGNWSITEEVENMVMVQVAEAKEDGTQETSQKQYTFVDNDHFVWIPNLSPELAACDAMIAFERQASADQVAAESDETETR